MASPTRKPRATTTVVGESADQPQADGHAPTCGACGAAAGRLAALLIELPAETLLPAAWLLARLTDGDPAPTSDGDHAREGHGAARFLSAEQYGQRRVPARSADWVRRRCAAGLLPGAFKAEGEWVVPVDAETGSSDPDPAPPTDRAAAPVARRHEATPARPSKRRTPSAPRYPRW